MKNEYAELKWLMVGKYGELMKTTGLDRNTIWRALNAAPCSITKRRLVVKHARKLRDKMMDSAAKDYQKEKYDL